MKSTSEEQIVAGIDVGGEKKGFHAVILRNGIFQKKSSADPAEIVRWCIESNVQTVAVDAPCGWSLADKSRLAERALNINGQQISCFSTPTQVHAEANEKGFYDWVFNGARLYDCLTAMNYRLFDGADVPGKTCFETFPQAIACALAGKKVSAKQKTTVRRSILSAQGYDHSSLPNIDFVDAALCAVAAKFFIENTFVTFGEVQEGFIVVPALLGAVTEAKKTCRQPFR